MISGMDSTTLALTVDVSYKTEGFNIAEAVKTGNVAMVWALAASGKQIYPGSIGDKQTFIDQTLSKNVQAAYDAGVPCGLVVDWNHMPAANWKNETSVQWHFDCLKEAIGSYKKPGISFHAIRIDVADMNSTGPNCSEQVLPLLRKIQAQWPTIPVVIYSSMTILDKYAQLYNAISTPEAAPNYNLEMAQWIYGGFVPDWTYLHKAIATFETRVRTPGFSGWLFFEWAGSLRVILYPCANRFGFFHGTRAALYKWLKYAPSNPTPEEPPVVVDPVPNTELAELKLKLDDVLLRVASLEATRAKVREA